MTMMFKLIFMKEFGFVSNALDHIKVARDILAALEKHDISLPDSASLQSLISQILVTSRKESVAKKMKSSSILQLEMLLDEECWRILSEVAFHGRDRKECENLEDVGREIAKKSKGLPLVAKTLGGSCKRKKLEKSGKMCYTMTYER
ncbi:putative disease resistance protein RGA3 [Durio zibethinus]|uniref:Disease resistance protein RGA3 n=1 Tax=Durio zibethinus TaxID=66656 RepID=A0A6P6AXL9_DURZI|nr:putative disease resistance protein RGA3 [Durio zibethinus]